jgi:hypothetical protein
MDRSLRRCPIRSIVITHTWVREHMQGIHHRHMQRWILFSFQCTMTFIMTPSMCYVKCCNDVLIRLRVEFRRPSKASKRLPNQSAHQLLRRLGRSYGRFTLPIQ